MIEESLLKKHFIGRDGFHWWIGQVVQSGAWSANQPSYSVSDIGSLPGFKRRVKVRIFGYHTADTSNEGLPDDDLPWAYCIFPVTAGSGGGGMSQSASFSGGEFVFGFFIDGEDAQQPCILGVLDKSSQESFGTQIPPVGFVPFSGYTNKIAVPQTDTKVSSAVSKTTGAGTITSLSNGGAPGPSQSTNITNDNVINESAGSAINKDVLSEGDKARAEHDDATGEVKAAEAPPEDNSSAGMEVGIKRLSKLSAAIKNFNGQYIDKALGKIADIDKEQQRIAGVIASFIKDLIDKTRATVLKQYSDITNGLLAQIDATLRPKIKDEEEKAMDLLGCVFDNIINTLLDFVLGYLKQQSNKLINFQPCALEDLIGNILGDLLSELSSAISGILSAVSSILGAIGGIASSIASALDFISSFTAGSLFTCEVLSDLAETTISSLLSGSGISNPIDFSNILGIATQVQQAKDAAKGLVSGDDFKALGDSLTSAFQSITSACNTGPVATVPPGIQLQGGSPTKPAKAEPVVNDNGQIIAVNITDPGEGYKKAPKVVITNPGPGKGAFIQAVVDKEYEVAQPLQKIYDYKGDRIFAVGGENVYDSEGNKLPKNPDTFGKVIRCEVLETGLDYLQKGDGSLSGNGKIWARNDQTVVQTGDGDWYKYDPGTVIRVDPDTKLYFPTNTFVTLPGNATDCSERPINRRRAPDLNGTATFTDGVLTNARFPGTDDFLIKIKSVTQQLSLAESARITGRPLGGIPILPAQGSVSIGKSYVDGQRVATEGGTGRGLTVDVTTNDDGSIKSFVYNTFGSGYTKGDEITITGGNSEAKFRLENVADTIAQARLGIASTIGNITQQDTRDQDVNIKRKEQFKPAEETDASGFIRRTNGVYVGIAYDDKRRPISTGFQAGKDATGKAITNSPQVVGQVVDEDVSTTVNVEGKGLTNCYIVPSGATVTCPYRNADAEESGKERLGPFTSGGKRVNLCLTGVRILQTGVGYNPGDELIITPEVGDPGLRPTFDPDGSLLQVKVTNKVCGWDVVPDITLNSRTGAGAVVIAIMEVEPVGLGSTDLTPAQSLDRVLRNINPNDVVSIKDCVGPDLQSISKVTKNVKDEA